MYPHARAMVMRLAPVGRKGSHDSIYVLVEGGWANLAAITTGMCTKGRMTSFGRRQSQARKARSSRRGAGLFVWQARSVGTGHDYLARPGEGSQQGRLGAVSTCYNSMIVGGAR